MGRKGSVENVWWKCRGRYTDNPSFWAGSASLPSSFSFIFPFSLSSISFRLAGLTTASFNVVCGTDCSLPLPVWRTSAALLPHVSYTCVRARQTTDQVTTCLVLPSPLWWLCSSNNPIIVPYLLMYFQQEAHHIHDSSLLSVNLLLSNLWLTLWPDGQFHSMFCLFKEFQRKLNK